MTQSMLPQRLGIEKGTDVESEDFEALVVKALRDLPEEFQSRLENIDVLVQEHPTPRQLAAVGHRRGWTLLGLYEGVPHTERTRGYHMALPDKITLFQKPIEAKCRGEEDIAQEIKRVVCHEIAHHFGIDDERLLRIEGEKPRKTAEEVELDGVED